MAKFMDTLHPGLRAEVAFTIQKFNDLIPTERDRILKMLRSSDKSARSAAALEIGKLLLNADCDELTRFINEKLGGEKIFDAYLPAITNSDAQQKCVMVGMYAHENLPPEGQNVIPMP